MKGNHLESVKLSKGLLTLLAIAVLLTLWTLLQTSESDNTVVIELADERASASSNRSAISQPNQVGVSSLVGNSTLWDKLKREPLATKPYNPFKVHSWEVVPPIKKVKPEPPPPPVAPPAPFTYIGKLENMQTPPQIFLLGNGKLYTTQAGENIDQQWRLDAEETNVLRLTYLPLNLPQMLSKSAKSLAIDSPVAEVNL